MVPVWKCSLFSWIIFGNQVMIFESRYCRDEIFCFEFKPHKHKFSQAWSTLEEEKRTHSAHLHKWTTQQRWWFISFKITGFNILKSRILKQKVFLDLTPLQLVTHTHRHRHTHIYSPTKNFIPLKCLTNKLKKSGSCTFLQYWQRLRVLYSSTLGVWEEWHFSRFSLCLFTMCEAIVNIVFFILLLIWRCRHVEVEIGNISIYIYIQYIYLVPNYSGNYFWVKDT